MAIAFLALAHLVSLSFAQNLFYLSLILTPSPLSSDEELGLPVAPWPASTWKQIRSKWIPPKPANWHPHPLLFYGALVLNYGSVFVLPYAAGTRTFTKNVLIVRGSTFLPLILPEIVPVSWGTIRSYPHEGYSSFTKVFRFVSAVSFLLHFKATTVALAYNIPNSHYHRHSVLVPWDVEERSTWERSTTSLGKVLGAISDHPVVTAVGYDVLLSTLSLGLWAAVRATDIQDIIKSAVPFDTSCPRPPSMPGIKEETPKPPQSISIKSEPEPAEEAEPEAPRTLRRSGRRRKPRLASIASSSEETPGTAPRGRGRPRKSKPAEEESAYEPTPSESREVTEGDELLLQGETPDRESAALVWGLTAVGGLASASAGVFGAECISR